MNNTMLGAIMAHGKALVLGMGRLDISVSRHIVLVPGSHVP